MTVVDIVTGSFLFKPFVAVVAAAAADVDVVVLPAVVAAAGSSAPCAMFSALAPRDRSA